MRDESLNQDKGCIPNLDDLTDLAARVGNTLQTRGLMLAIAESCTGGWISQQVTGIAGSSAWLERGFVTYSDLAKQEMLGVRAETLAAYGAVSEQAVREMALGALAHSQAQVSVAVSGIAGPGGGTADKPVGTVWLAWAAGPAMVRTRLARLEGDRESVRRQTVEAALRGLLDFLGP